MILHAVTARRGAAGLTLVEMLTVVMILGILASIAVPTYMSQTRKSRRTEARTALLDLAGREERLFSTTNAYSATPTDLGYAPAGAFPLTVGSGYYTVDVTVDAASVPPAFTLTATPVMGKGQEKDTSCAWFFVTHTGKQSAASASGADASASCWD